MSRLLHACQISSLSHLMPKTFLRPVTLAMLNLRKFLWGHVWTVPVNLNINFTYVVLTILELLAFNSPKFGDHVTLTVRPLGKFLYEGHVWTVLGNFVKFEVHSFNHFGEVVHWFDWPVHFSQKHRHTLYENIGCIYNQKTNPSYLLDEMNPVR